MSSVIASRIEFLLSRLARLSVGQNILCWAIQFREVQVIAAAAKQEVDDRIVSDVVVAEVRALAPPGVTISVSNVAVACETMASSFNERTCTLI